MSGSSREITLPHVSLINLEQGMMLRHCLHKVTQPLAVVMQSLCMDLRYFYAYMCSVTQLLSFTFFNLYGF